MPVIVGDGSALCFVVLAARFLSLLFCKAQGTKNKARALAYTCKAPSTRNKARAEGAQGLFHANYLGFAFLEEDAVGEDDHEDEQSDSKGIFGFVDNPVAGFF